MNVNAMGDCSEDLRLVLSSFAILIGDNLAA
jgi:hypothetical protein